MLPVGIFSLVLRAKVMTLAPLKIAVKLQES